MAWYVPYSSLTMIQRITDTVVLTFFSLLYSSAVRILRVLRS